jgi:zinc/manganese transport system substrate-binding protein
VEQLLAAVPPERRVLVTNHDVFGYFAERYGFEVLGAVIPAGSTLAEPSAHDLDDLATLIEQAGVPAVFADTSAPSRLADALAGEGTDVEVVELYSESLGEPGSEGATYIGMVRTNARRIADALRG